jgi:hypothetical protein
MIKSISELVYESIPVAETIKSTWSAEDQKNIGLVGDKLSWIDLGSSKKVYIHHTRETIQGVQEHFILPGEDNTETTEEPEITETTVDMAYSIVCAKPVTYGRLINAAIHQEFSEADGEIDAINRKRFTDPGDSDVTAHDEFVAWVKEGLKELGWKNNGE